MTRMNRLLQDQPFYNLFIRVIRIKLVLSLIFFVVKRGPATGGFAASL